MLSLTFIVHILLLKFNTKKKKQNDYPMITKNLVTPIPVLSIQTDRTSPGSATLEDVLASLLGLPSDSYRPSGMNL